MAGSRRPRSPHVVEVPVTGKADLPIPGTELTITPATVTLTYRWSSRTISIEISGPRQGRHPGWTTTRLLPADPRPDWLTALVDEHRPDNWPTN
jgi:hypothetical protein